MYNNILPTKGGKPEPLIYEHCQETFFNYSATEGASGWLNNIINSTDEHDVNGKTSFSAFYSKEEVPRDFQKSVSTMLPLFQESVNSPAMVRHCMKIIKDLVKYVNDRQISVIIGNQPVYALGKQVQWAYQDEFKDMIWMMGPLHIIYLFIYLF